MYPSRTTGLEASMEGHQIRRTLSSPYVPPYSQPPRRTSSPLPSIQGTGREYGHFDYPLAPHHASPSISGIGQIPFQPPQMGSIGSQYSSSLERSVQPEKKTQSLVLTGS